MKKSKTWRESIFLFLQKTLKKLVQTLKTLRYLIYLDE